MPWFESLFDRSDDHRFEKFTINAFQVLNKSGTDVTDEHLKEIMRKINEGEALNKIFGQ